MPVDKLTIEQFAQKVKAKYPQYKDVNDSLLVEKIISKHPEYKERINYSQSTQQPTGTPLPQSPAFQVKVSEPTFKPATTHWGASDLSMEGTALSPSAPQAPIRTFTDQKPTDEYGLAKLKNKATEAKSKLDLELHSNDGQYEKKIREIRRDSFTLDDLKREAKEKGYIIPIGQEREVLRAAKQRQYDLPINQDDIADIKTGTIVSPDFSRQFIKELNSPEAQKQAYYVDAYNHAAEDADGDIRAPKIKANADKIGKGEYIYDPVNKVLGKQEGFIKSVISGRHDLNNSFDLYHFIKDKSDAAVTDRLNQELAGDIDEPVSVPEGTMGNIGRMMGAQPIKGMLAGGVASIGAGALTRSPEAAKEAFLLTNAAVSAVDMYKIGFANSVKANYALFKQQGLPDGEALQKAKVLGENQANMDAASAALMSVAAGKLAFKPTGLTLNTIKKPLLSALSQIGEAGAKKALEGLGVGSIGGVTQIIKNIQAQGAGLPVDTTEGFKEQLEAGVLLTVATHAIAKASASLKPSTLNKLTKAISRVPRETIESNLNEQQRAGHITPEEANNANDIIREAEALNKLIPDDLPETDRTKIADKIKERAELKTKLDTQDEAYHPEIKEKIKAINEAIVNISKGAERGELQNIVHKSKSSMKEELLSQSEKELEETFKTIAEWANDPASHDQAVEIFGKDIVEKAKELHPQIKTEENASNVRSDQEQIPLTGDGPEGVQEPSGSNIQLQESAEPLPPEAEQQAGNTEQQQNKTTSEEVGPDNGGMAGGIPPNMHDLPFTPEMSDVTRLAHADTETLYKELGLADRIPRASKEDLNLEKEADDLIRGGYDFEGKADRVISGRDKSFTDIEQVAFAKMVGALNVKLEKLEVNSPEFNTTLETINRLSRASDIVGSEEGAAFRARRMFMLNDETLSAFMQTARDANLDVPLTEEQAASVKARFDDMKASRDAYRARLEKVAADLATAKAERSVKKTASETKPNTKRTHEDYVKERQDIIAKMREDLLKVAKGGGGAMSSVPFAAQLIAAAPHVAKLVKSVIEEGIHNLPDIIKNVHDQVKEAFPGITEKNIHDIIAGEYSKKQTRSELQEKVYEIHLQAKLINRLEELKGSPQPRFKRSQLKRSAEIESLRKQIKGLLHPEKEPKSPKTAAETEASKLTALKARYKSQAEKLQKKIDAGDFEPDERSTIELDKEAVDLKDAYIKKKIEWQKTIAQDAFNNRSLGEKGKDLAIEILGIPRTVMSSMDFSAPLRQGLLFTVSHPIIAAKAFVEAWRQVGSPERFDRWLYDLKESNYYKNVIEKSKLYVADPNNLHLTAQEEAYMSNLAEKIPIVGGLISKSERGYVSYLNKLRVDVFTMYAKGLAEKGITPETRPDVYEALGSFVNSATGRGSLGAIEKAAPVLNAIFFSPRLIASRINMLNPVWYARLPKEVRIMALKDMTKMIGLGATTIGLLSLLPGASVEVDPRSPDFGKVKVGNTRWDTWGGFQQYIRLASQLISGHEKKSSGNVVPLGPDRNQNTKADKFFGFFRGKLSPIPSILVDYGVGKTAVGEDVELTSEMKEHLIPMIGNDVADAWKEQGPMSIVYTGVPSFLGVGTTTYKEEEPKASKSKSAHHKVTKNKKTKKQ